MIAQQLSSCIQLHSMSGDSTTSMQVTLLSLTTTLVDASELNCMSSAVQLRLKQLSKLADSTHSWRLISLDFDEKVNLECNHSWESDGRDSN